MSENLQVISFVEGEVGVTLGDNFRYFTVPFQMTIVAVTVSPSVDDADLTIDINDDGTGVITAISCADQNVPGTWKSTHLTGGTETPVSVAAGSVISFDANSAAANTRVGIVIWALGGVLSA
jgi:hypothetical protein